MKRNCMIEMHPEALGAGKEEISDCYRHKHNTKYYGDYPTEPIGHGNPYHRCISCKKSVPEINGELSAHSPNCAYRQKEEAGETIGWQVWVISQVLDALPRDRDWLDPALEKAMKDIVGKRQ